MKTLCFKLYGDLAHFKPYYTTSSPTTFLSMPPTAVFGLLGAILGLERNNNEYYKRLRDAGTRVGVGSLKRFRKISFGINLINTKGNYWVPTNKNSNGPRTPTRYEYIVNPEYLIFISMEDKILLNELAMRVYNHAPCYSLCLGLSELIADFRFLFYKESQEISRPENHMEMSSAVPLNILTSSDAIAVIAGLSYAKERYVKSFMENRVPADYVDVILSVNGTKPLLKPDIVYTVDDLNFTFIT